MHNSTAANSHIFLIGFMGSGKSYWGKKWSAASEFNFYDLDDIIEAEQQLTIAEIFEKKGEEYFRDLETEALHTLTNSKNNIVACGGGTPCFNNNISWMNENGITVYLQSSPENILQRLSSEKEKRPLINHLKDEELLFYIKEKIKERAVFYHQAIITLNVDDLLDNYLPDFLNK